MVLFVMANNIAALFCLATEKGYLTCERSRYGFFADRETKRDGRVKIDVAAHRRTINLASE